MKKYSLIYHINVPGGGIGVAKLGTSIVKKYQNTGDNHIQEFDSVGRSMGHACIMACVNNIPIFNLGATMKTYPGLYKELFSKDHYDRYQIAFAKIDETDAKPTIKLWAHMKKTHPNLISFKTDLGKVFYKQSGANSIQIIRNESLFDHRFVTNKYATNRDSGIAAWSNNMVPFPATKKNKGIYEEKIWEKLQVTDSDEINKRMWRCSEYGNCQQSIAAVNKFLKYRLWRDENDNDKALIWENKDVWKNSVKGFGLYTDVGYNANLIINDSGKTSRYEAKRYGRSWVVREHLFSVATSRLASMMIAEKFERHRQVN